MSTIRGKHSATQNSEEISFSPQVGRTGRWTIEGPKAAVKALLNELEAQGYEFVYRSDQSPKAAVVYSTPNPTDQSQPETPTIVWEYFAGRSEIDFLESAGDMDGANGTFDLNSLSDLDFRRIRQALQDYETDPTSEAPAPATTTLGQVYRLMLRGLRSHTVRSPTLRVSRLVSSRYEGIYALSNVGRVISTATLRLQENLPTDLFIELEASSEITRNVAGWDATFNFGWLKDFPSLQQSGTNRWNVSQEWVWGLYAVKQFGTAL